MTARLLIGDVRERIKEIPDGSVDLVCTSPPFLALRKYGDNADAEMGSEPTPAAFIDALLELTGEFRRVLAPHGSIAVELGDTYSGSGGAGGDYNEGGLRDGQGEFDGSAVRSRALRRADAEGRQAYHEDAARPGSRSRLAAGAGWPDAKSLCGTPFLYPLALAYGINPLTGQPSPAGRWRWRNTIAWCRPNPPVGALGDKVRPATSYITVACTSGRRWFDLDAVRTVNNPDRMGEMAGGRKNGTNTSPRNGWTEDTGGDQNPAGAPPLDWWEDDYDSDEERQLAQLGHIALIQATQPYSGKALTARRVPCGPDDGGERTTSPDCPVHADLPGQLPKALRDARRDAASNSTPHSGSHHEQGLLPGCAPTDLSTEPTTAQPAPSPECSPAASGRSTPSSRTAPAPSTSAPGTASEGTAAGIPGTSAQPESDEPHPDTPSSKTCADGSASHTPETAPGTARIEDPATPCTCSYFKTEYEYTSHYAVWPKTLAKRLIEMMCPREVCTQCGVPRERLVDPVEGPPTDHTLDAIAGNNKPSRFKDPADRIRNVRDLGWSDCGCGSFRPGVVLDPFAGSGTTLAVATGCGRDAIGIELYESHADLIRERCGMFLEVA